MTLAHEPGTRSASGSLFAWVGAVALCACESLTSGANPEVPLWVHRPNWALSVEYSLPLVASTRVAGEPYERGQPELDVAGRRVFVGSSDRGLYALSAVDGQKLWRFETMGFVQCEPLYAVYRKSMLTMMCNVLKSGKRKITEVFTSCRINYIQTKDESWLKNLNTKKDYEEYLHIRENK